MKTSNINIRIDADVKNQSTEILKNLGMDMTTAINLYLRQIIDNNGIPFLIQKRYNSETEQAIEETRKISSGEIQSKAYDDVSQMFSDILAD